MAGQVYGMHHIGITVPDIEEGISFFRASSSDVSLATQMKCHVEFSTSWGFTLTCDSNCLRPSEYRPA